MVLGNAGTAEFWTGDLVEAEKHLRAAMDFDRSGGVLRPHLNAAAHLALLHCERGDLDAAQTPRRVAVVEHATDVGWTVSAQVVAAYLTLAWVALDRDDRPEVDGWLGRVAEVEAVMPEPHIQLAAAALSALRRCDDGDPVGALSGLRLTTARLAGSTPPALTDRLLTWKLICCAGSATSSGPAVVLAGLHGPATAELREGPGPPAPVPRGLAAAEQALARFPDDGATVRGQVEGAILRSLIAAPQDRATALTRLDGRTARSGSARDAAALPGRRRPELRELLGARIEAGTAAAAFAVDLVQPDVETRAAHHRPSRPRR